MNVLVTGATGLVGGGVIEKLLRDDASARIHALVRTRAGWAALAARLGADVARVRPLYGDVTVPGCGVTGWARVRRAITHVVHAAADTSFSRPLAEARVINTLGTRHVLQLAGECDLERFVHVSTAFVAGARTGVIAEDALDGGTGFVNGYEQSKHEAELLVRASPLPWSVLRPSSIVCDDDSGRVTQLNAVHRALRLFHGGLAAMMPAHEDTTVDVVTNAQVVDAVVALGVHGARGSWHVCAGADAVPLAELLDAAHAVWSRDGQWRRRGILRPALTDLATYRLFEQSVEDTGDARLAMITRSLSHFVPQLALPKHFVTSAAQPATPMREYWPRMVEQLLRHGWRAPLRSAA